MESKGVTFTVDPDDSIIFTRCSEDSFIAKTIKMSNRIKGRPAHTNVYLGDCGAVEEVGVGVWKICCVYELQLLKVGPLKPF